ncbi:MAG: hypothetical protein ACFCD0_11935 [Gemmataceae bacterium]
MFRNVFLVCLVLSLLVAVGCGGGEGSKIKVKLVDKDKAVKVDPMKGQILIELIPTGKGDKKYQVLSEDGETFATDKPVPPGEYYVVLDIVDDYLNAGKKDRYGGAFKAGVTPIRVTIESGKRDITIDLDEWKGKKR